MKYVYLLQSEVNPRQRYVGASEDFRQRLKEHNAGNSSHTRKFRPWKPVVVIRFEGDRKADRFERYLETGSGHAFARRHFW